MNTGFYSSPETALLMILHYYIVNGHVDLKQITSRLLFEKWNNVTGTAICLVHARPVYLPLDVFPVMLRAVEKQDGGRSGWIWERSWMRPDSSSRGRGKIQPLRFCITSTIINEGERCFEVILNLVQAFLSLINSHNDGEGVNPPHCCVIALMLTLAFYIH